MQRFLKIFKFVFVTGLITVFCSSCLDKEVEGLEDVANNKYINYINANNYSPDEEIGFGIYVKEIEKGDESKPGPVLDNTVLLSYSGMYTDGVTVFETTDAEAAEGKYKDYFIYGPTRHKVGTMIFGFDTAIRTLHPGAKAEIVIPHQYAYGNYEPVVYTVELLEVVADDTTYEEEMFEEFRQEHGIADSDTLFEGLYYKRADGDDTTPEKTVTLNDTVFMELTAYFAEVLDGEDNGRQFFPRPVETETSVYDTNNLYLWGTTSTEYPLNKAIDSAIKNMSIGQTLEIAFESGAATSTSYGYGSKGHSDPNLNIIIVPPFTPLHYKIKLVDIRGKD